MIDVCQTDLEYSPSNSFEDVLEQFAKQFLLV